MNDNKLPLSVNLITLNEEERLARTLDSVKDIASEIIVIDSSSTDKTVEIAESYGAKVFQQEWLGYAEQKNVALSKCSNEWLLCLDADEVLTPELINEVRQVITDDKNESYEINRRTYYLGKLLKTSWQPDKRLRLVKRSANPIWKGEFVHESLHVDGKVSLLNGEMIHYSYKDIADHFTKTIKYARLSAESYYARGKKAPIYKITLTPIYSFFKLYILKRGFTDGVQGFIASVSACVYSFLKYAFLWDFNRNGKK